MRAILLIDLIYSSLMQRHLLNRLKSAKVQIVMHSPFGINATYYISNDVVIPPTWWRAYPKITSDSWLYNKIYITGYGITLVCLQKLELSCGSISLLVLTRISRIFFSLPLWLGSFQQLFTCTIQKMFLKKIKKKKRKILTTPPQ